MAEQKYDLYSGEFRARTHETYAQMREHDPVFRQPGLDGTTPIWFVTRHDDVVSVLLDDERFVLDPALALTPEELVQMEAANPLPVDDRVNTHLLTQDGESHRRLRRLVTKAFTPRMVEQLRPRIQEIADQLLDRVESRRTMDLVDDYAFPLPITVIAMLLGIPVEDRDRFRTWSNTFVSPPLTEELQEQFVAHTDQFVAYLDDLFERRRVEPSADLVSALVQAEEQGDRLSENELYSMVVLLIVAGHETTVSLIANAVLALLSNPEELECIRRDPPLVRAAVEELLRYDSPVERSITRWAAADVELGGQTIGRGGLIIAVIWLGQPRLRALPRFGLAPARARGREARRLRPWQPLLPRSAARAPGGGGGAANPLRSPSRPAPRDRTARALVAPDPALPKPRLAAGGLGLDG